MSRTYLKKLVRLLKEADQEVKPLLPSEEGGDSVDAQIDKFFVNYESEAKSSKNEGLDLRSISKRFLLEAGEDEEAEETEEETDEDESSDDKSEDEKSEETKKLTSDDIDINSFVSSVARLVDNYDNLLEIRNTILRRAAAFISKNYDQETVDEFKNTLSVDYDMEISDSSVDDDEKFPAPKAGFAGPVGGGGA